MFVPGAGHDASAPGSRSEDWADHLARGIDRVAGQEAAELAAALRRAPRTGSEPATPLSRLVHYSDLFDLEPGDSRSPDRPCTDVVEVAGALTTALLSSAVGRAPKRIAARASQLLHRGVDGTSNIPALEADWILARTLLGPNGTARHSVVQAARYLTDESLRDRIRARTAAALGPETRVVIGHSFGSVVAWEVCTRLYGQVPLLVTLGSPLGEPTAILPRLDPRPSWPSTVDRWLNLSHRDDLHTFEPSLAPHFPAPDGRRIEEHLTTSSRDHHGVAGYLGEPAVARAVVATIRVTGGWEP